MLVQRKIKILLVKKYFHNLPFEMKDEFYVSIVTPVIHYCMGGLEINHESEIIGNKGTIKGLFACGESAGGVHGANRLGGSSLLGCVVYGRVAGDSAARYLFRNLSLSSQSSGATSGAVSANIKVDPESKRVHLDISWDANGSVNTTTSTSNAPTTSAPATTAAPAPAKTVMKEYSAEEVAKHNTEKDCWVIVNGQVLDVTAFLSEHPGGKKAILLFAGKDATEEFNMLHKPDVVEKYAPASIIGTLKPKAKL